MQHATGEAVHLGEIGQIALTVRDLARAKRFYQETLGMRFLFEAGTLVFFQCGSVRLMLGLAETPVEIGGTILYFKVEGLERTHTALVEKGVTFLESPHLIAKMPDHDLWMAVLKDPDGNVLGLMSEVRATG